MLQRPNEIKTTAVFPMSIGGTAFFIALCQEIIYNLPLQKSDNHEQRAFIFV